MKEYKKLCVRCGFRGYFHGDHCPQCCIALADELYLDDGAVYQGHEDIDRKVTGEYAEANEGDDKGDDDEAGISRTD